MDAKINIFSFNLQIAIWIKQNSGYKVLLQIIYLDSVVKIIVMNQIKVARHEDF
jgi:hypothetical protein